MDQELQQIFTSSPFIITVFDKEMRVLRLNPAMETLVGFKSEEARGRHCYDCWGQYATDDTRHGIERICDVCQVASALRDGEKHSYEKRIGDTIFEIVTCPVRDLNGRIIGAMEVGVDITERSRATQSLRESENRYRSLFESSPNIICVADFSGIKKYLADLARRGVKDYEAFFRANPQEVPACLLQLQILEVNQVALSLFGAASQQEFIHRLFTIIGPETIPSTIGGICAMGRGEPSHENEIIFYHLQGAKIYGIFRWSVAPGYEVGYERVILSFTDITERKNAEDKLAQHREQLQKLSSRLIETEEIERRHIARQLHDQIGQQLTALGINLHILGQSVPPEQHQRIDDSLELIAAMTGQVRDIMADIRPPVLDDYGLRAALRWYGSVFTKRTGVEVIVLAKVPRLSANLEMALFRITQEALNNVIKHSQATEVEIYCAMDDNLLSLSIHDNGCGIQGMDEDMLPESQTWGLLSMRERIESFGGRLIVASRPGNGTVITVEVQI